MWTENDKANNFSSYLKGSAEQWYKNHFGMNRRKTATELINPKPIEWSEVVHAFCEKYMGNNAAALFIDQYNNFTPTQNENWIAMCQRYRTIADMAYPQLSDNEFGY